MNRTTKISALILTMLMSAGAFAQSAPESNGGDNAKSNQVTAGTPKSEMMNDTADSRTERTTTKSSKSSNSSGMAKHNKSSDGSMNPATTGATPK
jgi:hypothetical protein